MDDVIQFGRIGGILHCFSCFHIPWIQSVSGAIKNPTAPLHQFCIKYWHFRGKTQVISVTHAENLSRCSSSRSSVLKSKAKSSIYNFITCFMLSKSSGIVGWKNADAFFSPCNTRADTNVPYDVIMQQASSESGSRDIANSWCKSQERQNAGFWWSHSVWL